MNTPTPEIEPTPKPEITSEIVEYLLRGSEDKELFKRKIEHLLTVHKETPKPESVEEVAKDYVSTWLPECQIQNMDKAVTDLVETLTTHASHEYNRGMREEREKVMEQVRLIPRHTLTRGAHLVKLEGGEIIPEPSREVLAIYEKDLIDALSTNTENKV